MQPQQENRSASMRDRLRVRFEELKSELQGLRDRAGLEAHLGVKELDERINRLAPRFEKVNVRAAKDRVKHRAEVWSEAVMTEVRDELDAIGKRVRGIKEKVRE